MPIPKRKNPVCLNCNHPLMQEDNFCPECGQENNDRLVTFWDLMREVFGNIFAYDSQFIRSIVPFLFKPGYLTNQFLAGKRRRYIQPIKLYFATSFLFFLFYSEQFNFTSSNFNPKVSYKDKKDSTTRDTTLSFKDLLTNDDDDDDTSEVDSTKTNPIINDSVKIKRAELKNKIRKSFTKNDKGFFYDLFSKKNQRLIKDKNLKPEQLLDTLKMEKTFINILLAKQSIRIVNEGGTEDFINYAIGKLPIMMFIVMPIVALILKLLYMGIFSRIIFGITYSLKFLFHISHKTIILASKTAGLKMNNVDPKSSDFGSFTYPRRYYIEHLIFTLHLHAFLFFCFVLIHFFYKIEIPVLQQILIWSIAIWMVIYLWISFKKVYKESSIKTFIKINVLFISYSSSLVVCFLFLLLISLMLF